jgi:hypothetical protein
MADPRREMSTRLKVIFVVVGAAAGALLAYLVGRF